MESMLFVGTEENSTRCGKHIINHKNMQFGTVAKSKKRKKKKGFVE